MKCIYSISLGASRVYIVYYVLLSQTTGEHRNSITCVKLLIYLILSKSNNNNNNNNNQVLQNSNKIPNETLITI